MYLRSRALISKQINALFIVRQTTLVVMMKLLLNVHHSQSVRTAMGRKIQPNSAIGMKQPVNVVV